MNMDEKQWEPWEILGDYQSSRRLMDSYRAGW